MNYYCKLTYVGFLTVYENNGNVVKITFEKKEGGQKSPLIDTVFNQLNEYFEGKRFEFELPLNPHGTEFQKIVWSELAKIPYAETRSYKQIANAIGNPGASRAVGMANNKNPICIVIPCHRVIGTNGKLTGYAGGLEIKDKLLHLESSSRIQ